MADDTRLTRCDKCAQWFPRSKSLEVTTCFSCRADNLYSVQPKPIPKIKCDCGGDAIQSPHFDWCSTQPPKREALRKEEDYVDFKNNYGNLG